MFIRVLSRKSFEEFVFQNNAKPSIVISISSCGDEPPFILRTGLNKIREAITLNFNDTDERGKYFGAMEPGQAVDIAKFIKSNYQETDEVVVHCDAGQSRSAAVAAAILKYYTNDDSEIFDNPKFKPNMLCYRLTLNALMAGG